MSPIDTAENNPEVIQSMAESSDTSTEITDVQVDILGLMELNELSNDGQTRQNPDLATEKEIVSCHWSTIDIWDSNL